MKHKTITRIEKKLYSGRISLDEFELKELEKVKRRREKQPREAVVCFRTESGYWNACQSLG